DVNPVEFPVNVGSQLGREDDRVAKVLTAVALLADGVEHAVVGEQIYESLHVHALGQVVRAADECFGVGCHLLSPSRPVNRQTGEPKSRIWTSRRPDISKYGGSDRVLSIRPYRCTSEHTD